MDLFRSLSSSLSKKKLRNFLGLMLAKRNFYANRYDKTSAGMLIKADGLY